MTDADASLDDVFLLACDELEPERRARVEAAVQADAALAREAQELREAMQAVRQAYAVQASADFNASLRARLNVRAPRLPGRTRVLRAVLPGAARAAVAAALVVGVLALLGVLGDRDGTVAWADVVQAVGQADQFRLTAMIQDDDEEFSIEVYYRRPGLWRAQGRGTVQFIGGGEVKYFDTETRQFVAREDAKGKVLDVRFAERWGSDDVLNNVLAAVFRDRVPLHEPVPASVAALDADIQVFDYTHDPAKQWMRIWVLKESRLPVRLQLHWPQTGDGVLAVFDYSEPQPEAFFDPERFEAEVRERQLRKPREIYRAGQQVAGRKPTSGAQLHDLHGFQAPELIEITADESGNLKIMATDPQNRLPNGGRVPSEYERELHDNWGNTYLQCTGHGGEHYYMPAPPFRQGDGEHTITLRYVIINPNGCAMLYEHEETAVIPPAPEGAGQRASPKNKFFEDQALWHYLVWVGTLTEKLEFLDALDARPGGPSDSALHWRQRLIAGYDGAAAGFAFFEEHLLEKAIPDAFTNDRLGNPLADYLYYLLEEHRMDELNALLVQLERAREETLRAAKDLLRGSRRELERKLNKDKPYGVNLAIRIPEFLRELEALPKPRLIKAVRSRDGFLLLAFDRLGEMWRNDVQPQWAYPSISADCGWQVRASTHKDGRAYVLAEGSGDEVEVVFRPVLTRLDASLVPRIRWPMTFEVPAATCDTAAEAVQAHAAWWPFRGPGQRKLSPFQQARRAADESFDAGRYEEAMAQYADAAAMGPAELPEYARHPLNEGAVEGLLRSARLGEVKCLVKLRRLDEATAALDEIERGRPDLRPIAGRTEWDTQHLRGRARAGWQQCDEVRWMLLKARREQAG